MTFEHIVFMAKLRCSCKGSLRGTFLISASPLRLVAYLYDAVPMYVGTILMAAVFVRSGLSSRER